MIHSKSQEIAKTLSNDLRPDPQPFNIKEFLTGLIAGGKARLLTDLIGQVDKAESLLNLASKLQQEASDNNVMRLMEASGEFKALASTLAARARGHVETYYQASSRLKELLDIDLNFSQLSREEKRVKIHDELGKLSKEEKREIKEKLIPALNGAVKAAKQPLYILEKLTEEYKRFASAISSELASSKGMNTDVRTAFKAAANQATDQLKASVAAVHERVARAAQVGRSLDGDVMFTVLKQGLDRAIDAFHSSFAEGSSRAEAKREAEREQAAREKAEALRIEAEKKAREQQEREATAKRAEAQLAAEKIGGLLTEITLLRSEFNSKPDLASLLDGDKVVSIPESTRGNILKMIEGVFSEQTLGDMAEHRQTLASDGATEEAKDAALEAIRLGYRELSEKYDLMNKTIDKVLTVAEEFTQVSVKQRDSDGNPQLIPNTAPTAYQQELEEQLQRVKDSVMDKAFGEFFFVEDKGEYAKVEDELVVALEHIKDFSPKMSLKKLDELLLGEEFESIARLSAEDLEEKVSGFNWRGVMEELEKIENTDGCLEVIKEVENQAREELSKEL